MKFIKDKGWLITEAEYDKIIKMEGAYLIPLDVPNFGPEMELTIKNDIISGLSRPKICDKNKITAQQLDYHLEKTYRTKKINTVRNYLKETN